MTAGWADGEDMITSTTRLTIRHVILDLLQAVFGIPRPEGEISTQNCSSQTAAVSQ